MAINAHVFNELCSKALLSRQRSTFHVDVKSPSRTDDAEAGSKGEQGSVSSPPLKSPPHVNTWLAITPCAWVTSATLARVPASNAQS
jgi:hypothetical protein